MKIILLIAFFTIISFSCFSQEDEWRKANEKGSVKTYEKFIKKFPDSQYNIDAKKKIAEIEFYDAKEINTIKSYEEYLKRYPESLDAYEAKERLLYLKFEELKDITNFRKYLSEFPEGLFSKTIIEAHPDLFYKYVVEKNTLKDYNYYLTLFPSDRNSYDVFYRSQVLKADSLLSLTSNLSLEEDKIHDSEIERLILMFNNITINYLNIPNEKNMPLFFNSLSTSEMKRLTDNIQKSASLDSLMKVIWENEGNNILYISYLEASFKIMFGLQICMNGFIKGLDISELSKHMAKYVEAQQELVDAKTKYLQIIISMIPELIKDEHKIRCLDAISRLINTINLRASQNNLHAMGDFPYKINLKPSEIYSKLKEYNTNEKQDFIRKRYQKIFDQLGY